MEVSTACALRRIVFKEMSRTWIVLYKYGFFHHQKTTRMKALLQTDVGCPTSLVTSYPLWENHP